MTAEAPYGRTEGDQTFWDGAKEEKLLFQKCDDCGYIRWPAAGVCPECLSRRSTWTEVEGTGTVWSYVVYHRAYAGSLKDQIPYVVGLVHLDCGVRLVTRLVGFGLTEGADVRTPDADVIGAAVTVSYQEVGEHGLVPVFGPA